MANSNVLVIRPFNTVFFITFAVFLLLLVIASILLKGKSERAKKTVLVAACTVTFIGFFFYKYFLSIDNDYNILTASTGGASFRCIFATST